MKQTKKQQLFKIVAPKLKIKTKGYINLIAKNKCESKKGKPIFYRSKIALNVGKLAYKIKDKTSKLFLFALTQVGIFEANILHAKNEIKKALRTFENSYKMAELFITLAKAKLHLNQFKYSLPRNIRFNLF